MRRFPSVQQNSLGFPTVPWVSLGSPGIHGDPRTLGNPKEAQGAPVSPGEPQGAPGSMSRGSPGYSKGPKGYVPFGARGHIRAPTSFVTPSIDIKEYLRGIFVHRLVSDHGHNANRTLIFWQQSNVVAGSQRHDYALSIGSMLAWQEIST